MLWGLLVRAAPAAVGQPVEVAFSRDTDFVDRLHTDSSESATLSLAVFDSLLYRSPDDGRLHGLLAQSWRWSADRTVVDFDLRRNVRFHDGEPFDADDVIHTLSIVMDPRSRIRQREASFGFLRAARKTGPYSVRVWLKQPSVIAEDVFAGRLVIFPDAYTRRHGGSLIHRTAPIGTGPFKVVEFKRNESIKLARNPDYWNKGKPYLDAIDWKIVPNRSTRLLGFTAGEFDMTFDSDVTFPLLKDIKSQKPDAVCEARATNVSSNVLINRDKPPFDNPQVRKAMVMALDNKAFSEILSQGNDLDGAAMLPPPAGVWGVDAAALKDQPGYGPDIEASRDRARALMREAGYGPDKRLKMKVSTRNIASYRDLAVILVDQLKAIWIDAEVEPIDSAVYFNRLYQKNYVVAVNATGSSLDDPDQHFVENYGCKAPRNFNGYCNPELNALMAKQSEERDEGRRRAVVQQIEQLLAADIVRPILSHTVAAACRQAQVRGITIMVNSIYNGWRFEDAWLHR